MKKTTFRNVDIVNTVSGGRCIDTRPGNGYSVKELNLDNVTLETTKLGGYDQPLTIGGNSNDILELKINNSTIKAAQYYAITVFNKVDCQINNSVIEGWACLYLKAPDSSSGSAGSTFNINNSTFVSKNIYEYHGSNSFSAIQCEDPNLDNNVTIVADNSTFNIETTNTAKQAVIGASDNEKNMFNCTIKNSVINLKGLNAQETINGAASTYTKENTQVNVDNQ